MNREQKAAAIAEIAAQIEDSQAIFAVDYRGISVPQIAELRGRLRESEAVFKVVKNSLTERAADSSGASELKAFLEGPTALTFVRGDAASAAKAIADYGRANQLLPFKGGLMEGATLDVEQIRALSRLPSREALYGQLVGVVASPVSGLVRTLAALLGGLAAALGQVREKKESGEIPAGAVPSVTEAAAQPATAEAEAGGEPQAGDEPEAAGDEPEAAGEPQAAAEPQAAEPEAAAQPEAAEPEAAAEPEVVAEPVSAAEPPAAEAAEPESSAEPDGAAEEKDDDESSAESPDEGTSEEPAKEE
jgi:large subunit ribosomal protein L10